MTGSDRATISLHAGYRHLERRQTFVEEALLVVKPQRQLELLKKWNVPLDKFLDFTVSHELGHAFCGESDEMKAERAGQRLRKGQGSECRKLKPSSTITVQIYNYSQAKPAPLCVISYRDPFD